MEQGRNIAQKDLVQIIIHSEKQFNRCGSYFEVTIAAC